MPPHLTRKRDARDHRPDPARPPPSWPTLLAAGESQLRRADPGPPRPDRRGRRRRARLPARRRRGRARAGRARPTRAAPPASRSRPLDGVPIAVKDVLATEGLPTTCGSQDPRGLGAAVRRHRGAPAARGRPADPRQDQHGRVRDGLLDRALRLRPDPQPVGPRPDPRRLRRRLGGRRRRLRGAAGDRHRHRRLDPPARRRHRHGRREADVRRGLPLRPRRAGQLASTRPARSPAPCSTPRCCTRSSAATTRCDSTSHRRSRCPPVVEAARRGAGRPDRRADRRGQASSAARATRPACWPRFEESVELLVEAGAEVVEVSCPSFVHALAAYYLILPERGVEQPRQVRRHALRPAGAARRRRRPSAEEVMRGDPRRRLRRRGQAPDHPRHLRAVQRLLRRLLRPGAEGAHADQPRLRRRRSSRPTCWSRRPRRPRRSSSARSSTTRWRCTSTTSPPSRPTSPACRASRCRAGWPTRTACRPASRSWRRRSPTTGSTGSAPRSRPLLLEPVGRPAARPGPELWREPSPMTRLRPARPAALRRGARAVRPGPRARGPRRAQHRDQDVLRLPDRVRRRAQHPGLPDLPRACPARCRWSTAVAVESAIRIGLALNCEIAEWCRFARKNYFYPDMPKNFQTSQYDEPIAFDGWTSTSRSTARRSGSRSSAPTWRRTPASRCTSAARPAASTAPTTRWSTTTGPASR